MKIGELAKSTGVSRDAIRLYERLGLITAGVRQSNGYREFGEEAVEDVLSVVTLQHLGFSLRQIGRLMQSRREGRFSCRAVSPLLQVKFDELDKEIRRLTAVRKRLRMFFAPCRTQTEAGTCLPLQRLPQGVTTAPNFSDVDGI